MIMNYSSRDNKEELMELISKVATNENLEESIIDDMVDMIATYEEQPNKVLKKDMIMLLDDAKFDLEEATKETNQEVKSDKPSTKQQELSLVADSVEEKEETKAKPKAAAKPKKAETKTEEKKEEPKAEPKKAEPKKAEPKKAEPKKETKPETKKEETKAAPKKKETKKSPKKTVGGSITTSKVETITSFPRELEVAAMGNKVLKLESKLKSVADVVKFQQENKDRSLVIAAYWNKQQIAQYNYNVMETLKDPLVEFEHDLDFSAILYITSTETHLYGISMYSEIPIIINNDNFRRDPDGLKRANQVEWELYSYESSK